MTNRPRQRARILSGGAPAKTEPQLPQEPGAAAVPQPEAPVPDFARLATQTYMTTFEACVYLRFPSLDALYVWVHRQSVPKCRRGRTILFLRLDLDGAVAPARPEPLKGSRRR